MALADDADVIKTFPSDRADQPLRAETSQSRMPMAPVREVSASDPKMRSLSWPIIAAAKRQTPNSYPLVEDGYPNHA
jgi:hypothetical protein